MKKKTAHERNPCFELRLSDIQGRGAFAVRPIRAGTRIIEYAGERITDEEADRRYDDDAMDRHHTFLFAIEGGMSIDAAHAGNESRFINHSCEPNCEALEEEQHIYIYSMRAIAPGEELTYDYRYAREGTSERDARRLYPCRCGAKTCRGTILQPMPASGPKTKKSQPRVLHEQARERRA